MKNIIIRAMSLAIYFSVNSGAMAEESLPIDKYESLGKHIDAEYAADKAECEKREGNLKDICDASVKGKMNIAKAELEYNYKPNAKTFYNARIAQADADYSVATEKCDDKKGNAADVCEKEADAARTQQTAAAEAQFKTAKADTVAIKKSSDAHKEAETDMREANYAVAKEKCEALAGDSKDLCIKDAKLHFGM
ncbi:MAG: hypothetical protein IPN42_18060 [Methylococcaceae bacterium]|nr:hypothetical protein [Methylococcaceae bacterium]